MPWIPGVAVCSTHGFNWPPLCNIHSAFRSSLGPTHLPTCTSKQDSRRKKLCWCLTFFHLKIQKRRASSAGCWSPFCQLQNDCGSLPLNKKWAFTVWGGHAASWCSEQISRKSGVTFAWNVRYHRPHRWWRRSRCTYLAPVQCGQAWGLSESPDKIGWCKLCARKDLQFRCVSSSRDQFLGGWLC